MDRQTIKARIRNGFFGYTVEVQRAKYKHWFTLGSHSATDVAFRRALADGRVQWQNKIMEERLF